MNTQMRQMMETNNLFVTQSKKGRHDLGRGRPV